MQLVTYMFRKGCKKSDAKRDAGLTTPEDIKRYDDIQYGPDAKWNVLDVYRPKDAEGKLPTIISVHGGGWVYGDKELYQWYCMNLAQRGFAVVNFTYHLSPKYKYPTAILDTVAVFQWVKDHADEYGLDMDNLFGVGDSAGGHLLSVYCAMTGNADYAKTYGFSQEQLVGLCAVALNCGCYDARAKKEDPSLASTAKLMKDILPHKGTDEELHWMSSINFINENFPPTYIMSANRDFLLPQAGILEEKLQRLGVPYEKKIYGGEDHPLGHVFHCDVRSADAKVCNDDECEFFRKYMTK